MGNSNDNLIGYNPLDTEQIDLNDIKNKKIKTEIKNIIKSYAGFYDPFNELLQNAMDALDRREEKRKEIIEDLDKLLKSNEFDNVEIDLINDCSLELGRVIEDKWNNNLVLGLIDEIKSKKYEKQIWITVNLKENMISVTDNGIGFTKEQLRKFLSPNITFKNDDGTQRGNKGVGATFLAYGYNYIQIGTKTLNYEQLLELSDGRKWVYSNSQSIPVFNKTTLIDYNFNKIDRGSTFTLKFGAQNSKPKDLGWIGADTYNQWKSILLHKTPLGKVDLDDNNYSDVKFYLNVINKNSIELNNGNNPELAKYIYPHECLKIIENTEVLDKLQTQKDRNKYKNRNGVYSNYSNELLVKLMESTYTKKINKHDIKINKLNKEIKEYEERDIKYKDRTKNKRQYENNIKNLDIEIDEKTQLENDLNENITLIKTFDVKAYGAFVYTKDLFNRYNYRDLNIRKGATILNSGLQLATMNMIQGDPLSIPLNFETGYENQVHILVHFNNADPDLGRKGFQPELTKLGKEIAIIILQYLKKYKKEYLKPSGGDKKSKSTDQLQKWIDDTKNEIDKNPIIFDEHIEDEFFESTAGIPLLSEPCCEQDVIVLFNQLLGAGLIRGIKLISTSQNKTYDSLFKYYYPYEDFAFFSVDKNPLGIPEFNEDNYQENEMSIPIHVLEYKYNLNSLIEDIENREKDMDHIELAVVWELGKECEEKFNVISTLFDIDDIENSKYEDKINYRKYHGITHVLYDNDDSQRIMLNVICLKELIEFINKLELEE